MLNIESCERILTNPSVVILDHVRSWIELSVGPQLVLACLGQPLEIPCSGKVGTSPGVSPTTSSHSISPSTVRDALQVVVLLPTSPRVGDGFQVRVIGVGEV